MELRARAGPDGTVEVYTIEHRSDGEPKDTASAGTTSLSLPFIRRLVTREGGSFELREDEGSKTFSAVCRLPALGGMSDGNITLSKD